MDSVAVAGLGTGSGPGPGHNRGPSLAEGTRWRTYCWRVAQAAFLPTLLIEVLRLRVQRARDPGLHHKTCAFIRRSAAMMWWRSCSLPMR